MRFIFAAFVAWECGTEIELCGFDVGVTPMNLFSFENLMISYISYTKYIFVSIRLWELAPKSRYFYFILAKMNFVCQILNEVDKSPVNSLEAILKNDYKQ